MAKADDLKRMIDRANAELNRIESVPDPALMPVETVLFWEHTFPHGLNRGGAGRYGPASAVGSIAYKFVAIKVESGLWYTTAKDFDTHVMNDDELRDRLADENVSERYVVSEWLPLADYVPASPFESPAE